MFKVMLAAGVAAFLATGASAVTLDFVLEAANNERGVADGTVINFGGLNVTFSASGGSAYFDDLSGNRPAGLGVCTVLTGSNQCTPSNDDNITTGEAVTLKFGETIDLSGLYFYDADHYALASNDTLLIGLNGGALSSTTFAAAAAATYTGLDSIVFGYGGGNLANQFYVGGATATPTIPLIPPPVPLPAGAVLLLTGLFGLGAARVARNAA